MHKAAVVLIVFQGGCVSIFLESVDIPEKVFDFACWRSCLAEA